MTADSWGTSRVLLLVLGALPASILSVFAVLVLFSSFDRMSVQPVVGIFTFVWAICGLCGGVGAWASVVLFNSDNSLTRKYLYWLTILGLFSASIALVFFWANIKITLGVIFVFPIVMGIATAHRLAGPRNAKKLATIVGVVSLPVVLAIIGALQIQTCLTNATIEWSCDSYGTCERYMTYVIHGDNVERPIFVESHFFDNLMSGGAYVTSATFEVRSIFGRDLGFELKSIAGLEYLIPNKNRDIPEVLRGCNNVTGRSELD